MLINMVIAIGVIQVVLNARALLSFNAFLVQMDHIYTEVNVGHLVLLPHFLLTMIIEFVKIVNGDVQYAALLIIAIYVLGDFIFTKDGAIQNVHTTHIL